MTADDWKTFLDLLKVALECSAILAAGVWAAYTFGSLRQIARARAEIAKSDAERKKTEVEVERLLEQAKVGAVIQISLSAVPVAVPNDTRSFVEVTVEIFNGGGRNVRIVYPDLPLCVYAVHVSDDGLLAYRRVAAARVVSGVDPNSHSTGMLARAGGRYPLNFIVQISAPGLYLAVFSVPLSETELEIAREFKFSTKGRWSGKKYFVI